MRRFGPDIVGFAIPFALLVYLGLEGGGYGVGLETASPGESNGAMLRSFVGLIAWLLLLMGLLFKVLPVSRSSRGAWVAIGLLAALAAWTGLSTLWSDSPERSFDEFTRVLSYLGVFALAVAVQGPGTLRRIVGAVTAAIAVLALLALLSRLHPAWFPTDVVAQQVANVGARLNFPLDYWNGLAALAAIGIVPLVAFAVQGKHLLVCAACAAAIPVMSLAAYYTLSRAALPIAGIGLIVLAALHEHRSRVLGMVALGAVGSGLAIAAAGQRDALENNLASPTAASQGDEMILITLLVSAGVGLLTVAGTIAARNHIGPQLRVSRKTGRRLVAMAAAGLLVVGMVAVVSGAAGNAWSDFKAAGSPTGSADRLASTSGNGRYQYWSSTIDQVETAPLQGTGAGSFELWWQQNSDLPGAIRDAHSLYFETLGELGIVGLALLLGALGSVIYFGVRGALAAPPGRRGILAGACGGSVSFLLAMGVDWGWEIAILPIAFFLLAAPLVSETEPARVRASRRHWSALRLAIALTSIGAVVACGLTFLGTRAMEESQAASRAEDLDESLAHAERAADLQPWAVSPVLQQALVWEQRGDLDQAAELAYQAIEDEPLNWEQRIIAARIEQARGNDDVAYALVDNARSLYPSYLGLVGQPLPPETGVNYEPR